MNRVSAAQLTYRHATLSDLQQLKKLGIVSYGQYAPVLSGENKEKLLNFLNSDNEWENLLSVSTPFVCTDNDTIVGMAYLIPQGNPTDIYPADWCYIRMVGVHPDYAGKGIGKKLTVMCIEKAKELKEKTIALHTSEFMDAARHIYEGLGFIMVKEIPPRYGKRYWLYRLDL